MASVGYDNTVRIWNLSNMSVTGIIEDKTAKVERDGLINAVSWSPNGKDNLICVATVAGSIKLFDAKKSKLISRLDLT